MKIEIMGKATATGGSRQLYLNIDTPNCEICLMGMPNEYMAWNGSGVKITIEEVEEEAK